MSALVAVGDLREGDLIDLAGDAYADVGELHDSGAFEYEYVEVVGVEVETADCTRVDIEGSPGAIGFPHGHKVKLHTTFTH